MKVFVRTSGLADAQPVILAYYDDGADVSDSAHGEGVTVMHVPRSAFKLPTKFEDVFPQLVPKWREVAREMILSGEASRRIKEVLPPEDEASAMHELLNLTLQHGADFSQWPAEAKSRKAEIDDVFNYIRAVKERARSLGAVPANPSSDQAWPTRIKKFR